MDNEQKKSTHVVEIVPVVLEKHPNAYALSIVRVWRYQVVVRTDEWIGVKKGVYIQPDSVVPDKPEYAFLRICSACIGGLKHDSSTMTVFKCTDCGGAGTLPLRDTDRRIRVRKFRKEWSQGLLMKVPDDLQHLPIGSDVATELGISHYEPTEPNMGRGGGFQDSESGPDVPVYDVENWYRYKDVFHPGEQVIVTEKVHGANFRCMWSSKHNRIFVGSRQQWKREWIPNKPKTVWEKIKALFGFPPASTRSTNWWWKAYDKYQDQLNAALSEDHDLVLYGEVYGNVQDLKYGHVGGAVSLVIFDAYYPNLNWWLYPNVVKTLCDQAGLQYVPVLYSGPYDEKIVQELANGKTTLGGNHQREGIVVRSLDRSYDGQLRSRPQLKIVSNEYLERAK